MRECVRESERACARARVCVCVRERESMRESEREGEREVPILLATDYTSYGRPMARH